jgi:hypothetical protein
MNIRDREGLAAAWLHQAARSAWPAPPTSGRASRAPNGLDVKVKAATALQRAVQ